MVRLRLGTPAGSIEILLDPGAAFERYARGPPDLLVRSSAIPPAVPLDRVPPVELLSLRAWFAARSGDQERERYLPGRRPEGVEVRVVEPLQEQFPGTHQDPPLPVATGCD